MSKEVQMSIKMESDLRERFMAVAADRHRPAAQIIRDLMRIYIADSETSNALTADTCWTGCTAAGSSAHFSAISVVM